MTEIIASTETPSHTLEKPLWTKTHPLCLTEKHKLKYVTGGTDVKADVYMLCPCSTRPFKYKSLHHHKSSVSHTTYLENSAPPPPPPPPVWERAWYSQKELQKLITKLKKDEVNTYNTAKLKRLTYIQDSSLRLCKCGSACTKPNKQHLKSDLHKSWVLHGQPLDRTILRVRGFRDLETH